MYRNTRRFAVLAAGLVFLASGGAGAATTPTLTVPVQITKEDLNPGRTYSSPYFAVDPSNSQVIVGAFAELRTRRCGLVRTTDGGATWKRIENASPSPASYPNCNSSGRGTFPVYTSFGRNGSLYMALNGWDTQDGGLGGNVSDILAKSTNLGDSWEPVLARDNRGKTGEQQESDRPVTGLAVDAKTGKSDYIYIGASRRSPGFTGANSVPNQPIVIVSADGGKTFGDPINLAESGFNDAAARAKAFSSATTVPNATTTTAPAGTRAATQDQQANFGGFGPSMTVDDEGTVYAFWPTTYANLVPRPAGALMVSKSTDHGKTWTTSPISPYNFNVGSFVLGTWGPKGGPQGTLHVVSDGLENPLTAGVTDIYYYRSTDGGKTWTDRKNVTDDDPKQAFSQVYPNVQVSPNGRVNIAFFDTRDDPGTRSNDVYYVASEDNGTTWGKNIRITDKSIDRKIGVYANNADVNAPPGLAATSAFTIVGWDDTRNGDAVGQAQDIYSTSVQYAEVGGGTSKGAKLALAGVVGLLVVGVALMLVAMATRGTRGGATGTSEPAPQAKTKV